MRNSEFRALMVAHFGDLRAPSVATDYVFAELGGRTAAQALEFGIPPRRIWAAVCSEFDVPRTLWYGLPD